ncbi:type II toxin-antitoxin system VapC family toxin [Sphingomonas sp. SUN019]|uniref:type II toxin-antitoxin system VapC family toxin n=1 Tax=Sphingomonas sp. SUN019 TaxID=2937788 RepID=UPI002164DE77|nr:type II toxin-antitoxin system VapC family toxin [Sphingomonas sp. SUN019]UVO51610.1 type II toxin-antitoxin system VapC family toxin [Sphingomonas sp. SUN019]
MLLDTHIAVWLATDELLLTARERALFVDPSVDLVLSVISIWEVRTKAMAEARRGRTDLAIGPVALTAFYEAQNVEIASLHPLDCTTVLEAPLVHNDPFDEMLLVHAQRLRARLVTRDDKLFSHPLAYQP